jgi:hypothetical protein
MRAARVARWRDSIPHLWNSSSMEASPWSFVSLASHGYSCLGFLPCPRYPRSAVYLPCFRRCSRALLLGGRGVVPSRWC